MQSLTHLTCVLALLFTRTAMAQADPDEASPQPIAASINGPDSLPVEALPPATSDDPSRMPPAVNVFGDLVVLRKGAFGLDVGGLAQVTGQANYVPNDAKNDLRLFLFMNRARLRTTAYYGDYRLNIELGLGGEALVAAPNPGIALGLLDFNVDIPLHVLDELYFRVGQFKVPYGREGLTYSGFTQFVERSIAYQGFGVGRDIGASVNLRHRKVTVMAGVFAGGGRDVPQEFIPEKIGVPLIALRAGYGDVDDHLYVLKQNDLDGKTTKWALFASGLFMQDTLIGHSTVMNVKLADKNLLLNGNWNPYIGQSMPYSQGIWAQVGVDGAFRHALSEDIKLAGEFEVNYGRFSNTYGLVQLFAARAQVGVAIHRFELAFRWALLLPDGAFANKGVAVTGVGPIQEFTPAASYYIFRHMLKVVADLPIYVQTPVFTEPGVGNYVAVQMPNQSSVLGAGGTMSRQNIVTARLMLQASF